MNSGGRFGIMESTLDFLDRFLHSSWKYKDSFLGAAKSQAIFVSELVNGNHAMLKVFVYLTRLTWIP